MHAAVQPGDQSALCSAAVPGPRSLFVLPLPAALHTRSFSTHTPPDQCLSRARTMLAVTTLLLTYAFYARAELARRFPDHRHLAQRHAERSINSTTHSLARRGPSPAGQIFNGSVPSTSLLSIY